MKSASPYNKNTVMTLSLLIIPLLGLGIDIYVPSLPALTQYFSTSQLHVQNTLTIYLLGLGVSQLIAGNIVDAYGRRSTLLIALIGYVVLCLCIIHTSSIGLMIWFRFLQGIGAGFAAVSARSIFSDLFAGSEYYKKASYMTIAYSIGPVIAPFIGGYLQHYLGWEANFYFLLIYAVIVLILAVFLFPETIQKRHPISIKSIGVRYYTMFTHVEFMVGIICLSVLYALLMLFNLVGPFIAQVELHYSPVAFGYIALLSGFAWFSGMLTHRMTVHFDMNRKMNLVTVIAVLDLLVMFILAQFWFNLYVIILPLYILLFCCSIIFSCCFVHNPTYFKEYAATASAVTTGGFSLFGSWISNAMDHYLTLNTQLPLIYGYMLLVGVCILARFFAYMHHKYWGNPYIKSEIAQH